MREGYVQRVGGLAVLGAVALLGACLEPIPAPSRTTPAGVVVLEALHQLKTGTVGITDRRRATYVLVDVENRTAELRRVTVVGQLLDDAGAVLAQLPHQMLQVPAGERRTFAMPAVAAVPAARRATVQVHDAPVDRHPFDVVVTEVRFDREEDVFAATLRVVSRSDRATVASIAATFYDDAGRPLARPFMVLPFAPGQSRPLRLEGPLAATRGTAFVTEVQY